jgi:hypothetical protein
MMANKRSRHGLNAIKVAVKCRGLAAIDGRTLAARSLIQWRSELLRDLGGQENLSAQQMALVDTAVRSKLFIDHVDAYLLGQKSLVNRRSRAVLPVLHERQTLVDSLVRLLGQLGLERVAKDAGGIPDAWITKVHPVEEPEFQQNGAAPERAEEKAAE